MAILQKRIKPFLLRRTKEKVEKELPAKIEQTLTIKLNPEHKKAYELILQKERQKILNLLDDSREKENHRFEILSALTSLRLACLDVSAQYDEFENVEPTKIDDFYELIDDVVGEHKIIVFSQFTSFLKKVVARAEQLKIKYAYLDGASMNREKIIDDFKTGNSQIFFISLKAGGFGLNLTEADYVFLLDPWWNPAVEAQAIDRAHRIGQTKKVMVYRLIAKDTIEEKVLALSNKKAKLFNSLFDAPGSEMSNQITSQDIKYLIS